MRLKATLLLALLFLAALPAMAKYEDGKTPDMSLADLKRAMAQHKVTILDCNGTDSYTEAHIPGAIDFFANQKDIAKYLPAKKDALIVVYCGGPR